MSEYQILPLLVLLPLLSAPVCLLLPRWLPWILATGITWTILVLAVMSLDSVTAAGSLSYAMGGWAPPWGIELRLDAFNGFILVLVATIGALVMPFAAASVAAEIPPANQGGFYAAYLLVLAGLMGTTLTGDLFNLFVFLEISSLGSYILVSLAGHRRALIAAYQYLVLGTIGATFILIGIGLAYAMTGTLNMADLAARLPAVASTRTVHTAFAFIALGASIKLALFPLHVWLPNAYSEAPSVVSTFLAGTATKVAFYVLARIVITIFGTTYVFSQTAFGWAFTLLALAAAFGGSVAALLQNDLKRLLAWSSIAQVGYTVLGLTMATVAGLTAAVVHLFNHALMKSALFMAAGCLFLRLRSVRLADLSGIGWQMPWTMTAFTLAGISLIGLPPTAGFVSKWYLLLAAIERGWWPVALLILATSLLAAIYIWKVLDTAWRKPDEISHRELAGIREAPLSMLIPTWLLVLANFYFGLKTEFTVDAAGRAATAVMGGLSTGGLP